MPQNDNSGLQVFPITEGHSYQHNYADLPAVSPLESAANPATRQVISLFAKYAPGQ